MDNTRDANRVVDLNEKRQQKKETPPDAPHCHASHCQGVEGENASSKGIGSEDRVSGNSEETMQGEEEDSAYLSAIEGVEAKHGLNQETAEILRAIDARIIADPLGTLLPMEALLETPPRMWIEKPREHSEADYVFRDEADLMGCLSVNERLLEIREWEERSDA